MLATGVTDDEKLSVCVELGDIDDSDNEVTTELLSIIGEETLSTVLLVNDVNSELDDICRELVSTLDDTATENVDMDSELCVAFIEPASELDGTTTIELSIFELGITDDIVDVDIELGVISNELDSPVDDKPTNELNKDVLLSVFCTAEVDKISVDIDVVRGPGDTDGRFSLEKTVDDMLSSIPVEVGVGLGVAEILVEDTHFPFPSL